jgi:tetratricopeptide (TPR) repeat protein
MAKETENITPVESVLEEWLKQDFQEEPGRDFGVTLERLKRQLQTRKVGVLIDNLEPALDGHGRFINPHRRYVELLRVLADPSVKSVTLITSREPLGEGIGGITHYSLPSLNVQAWEDFFCRRDMVIDAPTLQEMHKAYGGNALAMNVLCDPIMRESGMVAYWQEYKVAEGLSELAVENLIKEQFNRLEEIHPEAYRLLCRLGCYRYQAVPTVPTGGLLCLLWDVPELQHKRVIESLRNLALVEYQQGEYWLHPVILAEAISRLRASEDWEVANQKAAEFWKGLFNEILIVKDANFAFEAFYHYVVIEDFNSSVELIFCNYLNDSKLPVNHRKMIGAASVGLGLNHESIYSIKRILDKISNSYYLSELWRFSGTSHHHLGDLRKSIDCHEKSLWHINKYLTENPFKDKSPLFFRLKRLQIACLVGFSHCLVDLGETEKASQNLEECLLMSDLFISEAKETFINSFLGVFYSIEHFRDMFLEIYSVLSFLKALDGCNGKAHYLAEKVEAKLPLINKYKMTQGYGSFFLGLTYKTLGEINKSFEMYNNSVSYAAESHNIEVKGKALTGLAELYRLQSDFETALAHHYESIETLDKIGAKCDLAEAYYQRGLTHQAMGNSSNSLADFQEAIRLYEDMEAPKQVAKVRQAMIPTSLP